MTPWVKRLLLANVIVFVVLNGGLLGQSGTLMYDLLTLFPPAVVGLDQVDVLGFNGVYIPDIPFRPWTLFTYMFLHAGFMHLLFNMIGLFFFGPRLEARLGSKGFLGLYFLSGLGCTTKNTIAYGTSRGCPRPRTAEVNGSKGFV